MCRCLLHKEIVYHFVAKKSKENPKRKGFPPTGPFNYTNCFLLNAKSFFISVGCFLVNVCGCGIDFAIAG